MKSALDTPLRDAARPQRRHFRIAALLALLAAVAAIGLVAISGWFITAAAAAGLAGIVAAQAFNYLIPSAAIRLLAIARTGARYGERLLGHQAALRTLARLRADLFAHIVDSDVADPARSSADGSARLIHDVDALEERLVRGPTTAGALAGLVATLAAIALASPAAALVTLLLILAAMGVARPLATRAAQAQERVQAHVAHLKRTLVEQSAAAADIAAYGLSAPMADTVATLARQGDAARAALARLDMMTMLVGILAAAVSAIAVFALSSSGLPLTMLAALAALAGGEMLATLLRAQGQAVRTRGSVDRLAALVSAPRPARHASSGAAPSLTLPLDGGQLHLAPGERLAITGRSGCGKTRLLETLAGWRDNHMPLAMDDRPLQPGEAAARRLHFALAPQDAGLIAGTLADNLRLARPGLDEAALWRALETACLAADVRAMPEGLGAWVGDGGARLSGGQRKRLSIARALLADRPWLLLDEPSEGLDPATEARLRDNLDGWLRASGAGLVMITHRPAMLALAGRHCAMTR